MEEDIFHNNIINGRFLKPYTKCIFSEIYKKYIILWHTEGQNTEHNPIWQRRSSHQKLVEPFYHNLITTTIIKNHLTSTLRKYHHSINNTQRNSNLHTFNHEDGSEEGALYLSWTKPTRLQNYRTTWYRLNRKSAFHKTGETSRTVLTETQETKRHPQNHIFVPLRTIFWFVVWQRNSTVEDTNSWQLVRKLFGAK